MKVFFLCFTIKKWEKFVEKGPNYFGFNTKNGVFFFKFFYYKKDASARKHVSIIDTHINHSPWKLNRNYQVKKFFLKQLLLCITIIKLQKRMWCDSTSFFPALVPKKYKKVGINFKIFWKFKYKK